MLSQLINNGPSNEMQMMRGKINHELTNFLCEVAPRNLANQFQSVHSDTDNWSLGDTFTEWLIKSSQEPWG